MRLDSVKVVGGDRLLYDNRIVLLCHHYRVAYACLAWLGNSRSFDFACFQQSDWTYRFQVVHQNRVAFACLAWLGNLRSFDFASLLQSDWNYFSHLRGFPIRSEWGLTSLPSLIYDTV